MFPQQKQGFKIMGDTGLEHPPKQTSEVLQNKELNSTSIDTHESIRVQNQVQILDLSPDLATVIKSWTELPDHVRQTILTLVDASKKK